MHKEDYICDKKPANQKRNTKAVRFRNSITWQQKREEIKKRDKHLCQVCIRNLYNPRFQYQYENIQVHHAIPVIESDSGHLDNNNLITICAEHHRMADNYKIPLLKIQKIIKEQENKS